MGLDDLETPAAKRITNSVFAEETAFGGPDFSRWHPGRRDSWSTEPPTPPPLDLSATPPPPDMDTSTPCGGGVSRGPPRRRRWRRCPPPAPPRRSTPSTRSAPPACSRGDGAGLGVGVDGAGARRRPPSAWRRAAARRRRPPSRTAATCTRPHRQAARAPRHRVGRGRLPGVRRLRRRGQGRVSVVVVVAARRAAARCTLPLSILYESVLVVRTFDESKRLFVCYRHSPSVRNTESRDATASRANRPPPTRPSAALAHTSYTAQLVVALATPGTSA